ncbi:MAG: D-alanine--D-alanine ligase, partial [Methylococcales bacterium]|nr:D-alanine--D-alanine ligase [Methylococcales bacterium]
RTKRVWQGAQLPTANYMTVTDENLNSVAAQVGLPLMIKPAEEGSSIGMAKVESQQDLLDAWGVAKKYNSPVLAEAWIEGSEYTVAIVNGTAFPIIRLVTENAFYDYDAKYQSNSTEYICPCGLSADVEKKYQDMALVAFSEVGALGWGRVDFMIDEQGKPWLLEVNTVPGMTDHSLVPMAAKAAGMTFENLVLEILDTSLA